MSPLVLKPLSEEVLIVGGSLSGLTFALACASRGLRTRVVERVHGRHKEGGALGVDRSLLMRAAGLNPQDKDQIASFPVLTGFRKAASWLSVYNWLRAQAAQRAEITLLDGITVCAVLQNDSVASVNIVEGQRIDAPVIVGADGYWSVVQRAIEPDRPSAQYSGYLLWRGMVPERDLPPDTPWPQSDDGDALATDSGYRLVVYPVAGENGSLKPGERLISFAWYDPNRLGLLRELQCVSANNQVLSSLRAADVPTAVRIELRDLAMRVWPSPWCAVIAHALEQRCIFATPIAEHFPRKLSCGRLTIIGDAAHVVSPVTGKGFMAGIMDADALAESLGAVFRQVSPDVSQALRSYEDRRLPEARSIARQSIEWSQRYLRKVEIPSAYHP